MDNSNSPLRWPWKTWISWLCLTVFTFYCLSMFSTDFAKFFKDQSYLLFRTAAIVLIFSWVVTLITKRKNALKIRNGAAILLLADTFSYMLIYNFVAAPPTDKAFFTAEDYAAAAKSYRIKSPPTENAKPDVDISVVDDKEIEKQLSKAAQRESRLKKPVTRGLKSFEYGVNGSLETSMIDLGHMGYRLQLDSGGNYIGNVTLDLLNKDGFPLIKHSFNAEGSQLYTGKIVCPAEDYEKINNWNLEKGLSGTI